MSWFSFTFAVAVGVVVGFAMRHNDVPKRFIHRAPTIDDRTQKSPLASPCPNPKRERVLVALIAGQSNAANHGEPLPPEPDSPRILNLIDGQCFVARHPLLGATGDGSSPWLFMARELLANGAFDQIVIVTTAVGGSGIADWQPGGRLHRRLVERASEAESAGLPVTHFLWHQGERDAYEKTEPSKYAAGLRDVIGAVRRVTGKNTPAVISIATLCRLIESEAIATMQREAAKTLDNVRIVDSDAIGRQWRYDGCHFLAGGLEKLGHEYARAIAVSP